MTAACVLVVDSDRGPSRFASASAFDGFGRHVESQLHGRIAWFEKTQVEGGRLVLFSVSWNCAVVSSLAI
jgi:hypothetical protein